MIFIKLRLFSRMNKVENWDVSKGLILNIKVFICSKKENSRFITFASLSLQSGIFFFSYGVSYYCIFVFKLILFINRDLGVIYVLFYSVKIKLAETLYVIVNYQYLYEASLRNKTLYMNTQNLLS